MSDGLIALEAAQNMRRAAREYQEAAESLRQTMCEFQYINAQLQRLKEELTAEMQSFKDVVEKMKQNQ